MMKLLDFFTILIILASVIFGKPVDRRGPPQPAVQEAGSPNAEVIFVMEGAMFELCLFYV